MLNTSQKISIARFLSKATVSARRLCGLSLTPVVTRSGIQWSLDLKEGIDLSIYLLGGFEPRTLQRYKSLIREGSVVLDIGANIGAHTLPLAQLVGAAGSVIAFEPTHYAFEKLKINMGLNPLLSDRITANQRMLVRSSNDHLPNAIYSSWPLDSTTDLHTEHQGRLKSTSGAKAQTLDEYIDIHRIQRVDFVKLDVDGHENDVLQGALATLSRFKPTIMLELAPYVYSDRHQEFDGILQLLWNMDYALSDLATGTALPRDAAKVRAMIPSQGGMNALARITP
jgi:FkbM family methyltransferase